MSDETSLDEYRRFAEASALQILRGLVPADAVEVFQLPEHSAELNAYISAAIKLQLAIIAFKGHPNGLVAIDSAGIVYCNTLAALCNAGDIELSQEQLKGGAARH